MKDSFSTYRKFIYKEDALDLIDILEKNKIDYVLEDNSLRVDASFGKSDNNAEFLLKIDSQNFEKVEKLEEELINNSLNEVDKDYYLFEYSDEELMEIVLKKEEWSKFDYLLAQKILKERGKEINSDLVNVINKKRIEDLSHYEASPNWLIYFGYFFAIIGGLFGVFIGLYIMKMKKTLPNGQTMYIYKDEDRKRGESVLISSIIGIVFWLILRIFVLN